MPSWATILSDINILLNIFMGLLVCYLEIRLYLRGIRVKLAYASAGFVWAAFYVALLIFPEISGEMTRLICLRPLITLTLAVFASGAIIRYRSLQ